MTRLVRVGSTGKDEMMSEVTSRVAVRDLLSGLTDSDRLDAAAIKNLPAGGGPIINSLQRPTTEFTTSVSGSQYLPLFDHTFPAGTFEAGDYLQCYLNFGVRVGNGLNVRVEGYVNESVGSSNVAKRWMSTPFFSGHFCGLYQLVFLSNNLMLPLDTNNNASFTTTSTVQDRVSFDYSANPVQIIVQCVVGDIGAWWLENLALCHYRPTTTVGA